MSELTGDLQRRLANIIRRGVIHAVRLEPSPQCQVDLGDILTDWLPVCQGFSGPNRADINPCAPGDAVTVLSEAGELRNGRVIPGWNTVIQPAPAGSETEHITRYGDGTEVRYNRTDHRLTITLAEKGSYIIKGEGILDGNVKITNNLNVNGSLAAKNNVADARGTMSAMRDIFNNHNHPGDSGGMTDKPNQKM